MTKSLSVAVMVLALALSACAPRSETPAERLMDEALGAQGAVTDGSAFTGATADAEGLRVDFSKIEAPHFSSKGGSDGLYVQVELTLNGETRAVWTNHFNPSSGYVSGASGETLIAGHQVRVSSYCKTTACRQYYIVAEISRDGLPLLQVGLRYDFDSISLRRYTIRAPGNFHGTFSRFVTFIDDDANFVRP